MGREVRRVTPDWVHPKDAEGRYIPLLSDYHKASEEFLEMADSKGLQEAVDYFGQAPNKDDYMLVECPEENKTHLMMYETISEGTPISPAFSTPEELAHWLADTGASAFGSMTAPYDAWLNTIKRGWAPSAILSNGNLQSGVDAIKTL